MDPVVFWAIVIAISLGVAIKLVGGKASGKDTPMTLAESIRKKIKEKQDQP